MFAFLAKFLLVADSAVTILRSPSRFSRAAARLCVPAPAPMASLPRQTLPAQHHSRRRILP